MQATYIINVYLNIHYHKQIENRNVYTGEWIVPSAEIFPPGSSFKLYNKLTSSAAAQEIHSFLKSPGLRWRAANGEGFSSDGEQHLPADETVIKISQMNGNESEWNHKRRKNVKKNHFRSIPHMCMYIMGWRVKLQEFGVTSELTSWVTVKLVSV